MPSDHRSAVNDEPTRDQIDTRAGLTVLEFGASWCPICQAAQPAIAEALATRPGLTHLKIEDGKGKPLGRSFRVKLWPTLVFLRDGVEVDRIVRPEVAGQIKQAMNAFDR